MAFASLMASLLALGCAQDSNRATSRDSAGIRIVENTAPRWSTGEGLTLSASPVIVLGTQDGLDYQFSRIAGMVRLAEGRIVVADGANRQLRFFDSTGRFLRSAGRAGRGPGEFRSLHMLQRLPGDTLIAGDYNRDALIFTSSGDFVRNVDGIPPFPIFPLGDTETFARFSTGASVVGNFIPPATDKPPGSRWVHYFTLAIPHTDSASARIVGEFPQGVFTTPERGRTNPWFAPYLSFAHNERSFFIGFGNEYSIRAYSSNGDAQRIIRRSWTPVKVSSDDIERLVAEKRKEWASQPAMVEGWLQWLRTEPMTDTVPAFAMFIADRAGRLWVREARPIDETISGTFRLMPQEGSAWSVFDEEGQWLCDVTMPPLFLPMEIGADYVLGSGRTTDDVQTVVMYRLEKGS